MSRVLLLATTTGYQTRSFGEAAERLGVELVFATDRCHMIEDPWRDGAIPIRFFDEPAAVDAILESSSSRGIDGIVVVGDRPTTIGACVGAVLGLPGHSPEATGIARNKLWTRQRLSDAGLPVPWFIATASTANPHALAHGLDYPVVLKPVALSGSRGVIRADNPEDFVAAFMRLRALLRAPDIQAERSDAHEWLLVEKFIPGREYAVEALLHHGVLKVLAVFDKPDPLDGPFFEETIYVTPSGTDAEGEAAIVGAVARAVKAIGLEHGPVHAECRVNPQGVYVLEVAARPIGGLCARALRFVHDDPSPVRISLEELLLRHSLGESPESWEREPAASGVMMIPIPRRGTLRRVAGINDARAVPGVDDVRITAKTDQLLIPLPEGSSYLGFIFARAAHPADVETSLRDAHRCLSFAIDPDIPVVKHAVQSPHG